MQQVQQSMMEGPVYEVDKTKQRTGGRIKAVAANLGVDEVKQHDVGCHEESSGTGTQGVKR